MELTLTEFVVAILLLAFLLVFSFALISRMSHASAERRAAASRIICRLCLCAYEVEGREKIQSCPQCGAANERGRSRRLG